MWTYPPLGSRALARRSLLPQRRQRLAFQALRELQSMQIFFTSVLASASGNRAISSPAGREREMPYLTVTAPVPRIQRQGPSIILLSLVQ